MSAYQPKTGQPCSCRKGQERDNCPQCEGTGQRIDFAAIRARRAAPGVNWECGGSGPHTGPEVRTLPTGGESNAILCRACFEREIRWRVERNRELSDFCAFKRTEKHQLNLARLIDATDLPALIVVAFAAQDVIDAGRPHGGVTLYQHPDGCECEQCEAWDTLKGALAKLHCQAESDCGTVAREILTEAMRNITP